MKVPELTTVQQVKDYLSQSEDLDDFGQRVHDVKDYNDGYPDFWWTGIIKSGFYDSVVNKWGADSKLRVTYPDDRTEIVK